MPHELTDVRRRLREVFDWYRNAQVILNMRRISFDGDNEPLGERDIKFIKFIETVDDAVAKLPDYQQAVIRRRYLYGIHDMPSDSSVMMALKAEGLHGNYAQHKRQAFLALNRTLFDGEGEGVGGDV